MQKYNSLLLSITLTNNNILLNLVNLEGKTLIFSSVGTLKIKGTKKITITSLKMLIKNLSTQLQYSKIHIKIKGLSKYKRFFLKLLLKSAKFEILSFCDLTSLPHNGVRKNKVRRI
uniref:ribosomal protein S11 n=1 Tax=Centroceras gasparrinii TaxID=371099 RepID=UPI002E79BAFA|nr:ribosomal protein S11 [Centroceras gasparrinii]WQF69493.1 ribosomal protein S11 [Centroceras gasparrinii]